MWSFVCDRRVPCGKVRIVCQDHRTVFTPNHYILSPSFPQISLLCALACEVMLTLPPDPHVDVPISLPSSVMHTRSYQRRFITYSSDRRSHRREYPTSEIDLIDPLPTKRAFRRPPYTVKQLVAEIDTLLTLPPGDTFWTLYQHMAEDTLFREVAPCLLNMKHTNDYIQDRNVLWSWCDEQLLHRCSETYGIRMARILLHSYYTAEILICVKPYPSEMDLI